MTFIISAATRNAAFQIADTRVVRAHDLAPLSNTATKTIVIHCKDAKLALSFTGLAHIHGQRVDTWVSAKLASFAAPTKVFQEIANTLRDELTTAADPLLAKYGLELSIIGLGVSPQGVRQPAIAIITNCSEPKPNRNEFSRKAPTADFARYILNGARDFVGIYGWVEPGKLLINGLRKNVQQQIRALPDSADPKPVLDRLVAMLRLHRTSPMTARAVGSHCTAVGINGNFRVAVGSYGSPGQPLLLPKIIGGKAD